MLTRYRLPTTTSTKQYYLDVHFFKLLSKKRPKKSSITNSIHNKLIYNQNCIQDIKKIISKNKKAEEEEFKGKK